MTPEQQDYITKAIVSHEYKWCRARLLHALAAAYEQDVLESVLDELFVDDNVQERIINLLWANGWMK